MRLSPRQIIASTVGAVLAAVIASLFGVKGTIIGVAVGSIIATTGTVLVNNTLDRTHQAVRQVVVGDEHQPGLLSRLGTTAPLGAVEHDAPGAAESATPAPVEGEPQQLSLLGPATAADAPTTSLGVVPNAAAPPAASAPVVCAAPTRRPSFSWPTLALSAAGVFVAALLIVTAVELAAGKPLASLFGVSGAPTSGTSLTPSQSTTPTPPPATTTTAPSPTTTTTTSSSTLPPTTTSTPSAGGSVTTTTATGSTSTTGSTTTTTTPAPAP